MNFDPWPLSTPSKGQKLHYESNKFGIIKHEFVEIQIQATDPTPILMGNVALVIS